MGVVHVVFMLTQTAKEYSVQQSVPVGRHVSVPRTVVDADERWHLLDPGELWRYRDLLWMLTLRDLKVRYRQAVIGAAWAVIQPLGTMLLFGVLFDLLGRKPSSGVIPYSVTALCGLLPWQLFASSVNQGSASLVNNRHVITKVYFPRLMLPAASVLCALVDFAIAFGVLAALMAWHGVAPGWPLLALPLFVLLAALTALAAGLWLSALNALYRDFMYVVPFLVQVGLFVSPVVYETQALIPPRWWPLYSLNPMVCVLEGFRWSLLGLPAPAWHTLAISLAAGLLLLVSGLAFFRRVEHAIADRI